MKYVFIIYALLFNAALFAQETNLEEQFQRAQEEDKNVLLYFSGSDWCKPCISLKKQVLTTDEFVAFQETNLLLVELDFPQNESELSENYMNQRDEIAEQYNPEGKFPFLVMLNNNGEVITSIDGYKDQKTSEIIKLLEE